MYENGGCTGKARYVSPGQAWTQIEHRRKRAKLGKTKTKDNRKQSKPYKCDRCKMWHVGTVFDFD